MSIELPPNMLSKIQSGEGVLFLGAGASFGAKHPQGKKIPSGDELRNMICDKFLGGSLKERPLVEVSEIAKNESSIVDVQEFIYKTFIDFEPGGYHKLISDFRWKAIVGTNYDLLIEKTYEENRKSLQVLYPVKHDDDGLEDKLKEENSLIYLKAHGCIKDYKNIKYPLILASEEYAKYKKNRHSVFAHLKELGKNSPLIFCGYNLSDPNINEILFDLKDMGISRPMYAVVDPGLSSFHERLWHANRFITVKSTFENFLKYLDSTISKEKRKLSYWSQEYSHSFLRYLKKDQKPTPELLQYIDKEFDLLDDCLAFSGVLPSNFYRGSDSTWGAFASDLDVKREVTEDILTDSILDTSTTAGSRVFLIKGHAGSGKTIVLKRIAWNAHKDFKSLCLFLKPGGTIKPSLLNELANVINCHANIFISENYLEDAFFLRFIKDATNNKYPFNIFIEARINEWNVHGDKVIPYVFKDYEVRNLNVDNIKELLAKLEKHSCLNYLELLSGKERLDYCMNRANRQLLVMLYEITSGESFENIVVDEYEKISSTEARLLYLDICTLHRFNIGVRAGIISRVSGINFEKFQTELFSPLETLVFTYEDYLRKDIYYKTRHSDIAAIVFDKAVKTPQERVEQIIRLIKCLNLDYAIDNDAFFNLIKGKTLASLFGNRNDADNIFDEVLREFGDLPVIWHQRSVFETNHSSGSLEKALVFVNKALKGKDKIDPAIIHTKANVLRILADNSESKSIKEKYRNESKNILRDYLGGSSTTFYYHTYISNLLGELKDHIGSLGEEQASPLLERVTIEQCREIDQAFTISLQKHPGDEHLLQLKAEYKKMLEDREESIKILVHAFSQNPHSIYLAIRLANHYQEKSLHDSIDILKKSLKGNHNSKELNFELAKYLSKLDEAKNAVEIIYCLNKSFSVGDSNYLAQFWYAYHNYMYGDKKTAFRAFEDLKKSRLPPNFRTKIRKSTNIFFVGKIKTKYTDYMFVECSSFEDHIYVHYSNAEKWDDMNYREEVEFELAFTIMGPCGLRCKKVKSEE